MVPLPKDFNSINKLTNRACRRTRLLSTNNAAFLSRISSAQVSLSAAPHIFQQKF
jgi:hypothetical protein